MVLVGCKYEPVSIDVNKEQDIPNTHKNQRKVKALPNDVDVGNET